MEQLQARILTLDNAQKEELLKKMKQRYSEYFEINPLGDQYKKEGIALTHGQSRILDMTLDMPDIPVHVVSQLLSFKGSVDLEILQQAIDIVVKSHEAFKVSFFKDEEKEWKQRAAEEVKYSINIDSELKEDVDIDTHVNEFIISKNWVLPDSTNIDFMIFTKDKEEVKVAIITHNLFFDAWSYEILVEEIIAIYKQIKNGEEVSTKQKELDFLSFVNWQNKWLETKESKTQLAYWKDKLAGVKKSQRFSVTKNEGNNNKYKGHRISFDLSAEEKVAIEQISKKWSVTPFMMLTSIIQMYLKSLTNEEKVLIGTINANRIRKHSETIIGYVLNYIPLITDIPKESSLKKIAKKNKNIILESLKNTDLPFEYLTQELNLNEDQSPLFDLLFIYENIPQNDDAYQEFKIENREIDRSISRFNITLSLFDKKDNYQCVLEYSRELFEESEAADFIDGFQSFIKEQIKD